MPDWREPPVIHNILIPELKPDDQAELAPNHGASPVRLITLWWGRWFRVREE